MFTLCWNHFFQLTCSFHWGFSPLLSRWTLGLRQGLRQNGGIGNALTVLFTRFEPSGSFRFGFEIEGVRLALNTLFGYLGLNKVKSFAVIAVISPAKRFWAPAPTVWSHHENRSCWLSLSGLFIFYLVCETLSSGLESVSHENPPSVLQLL
jgi:hypothetical protein